MLVVARGVSPASDPTPLYVGAGGVALALLFDILFITPVMGSGATFLILAVADDSRHTTACERR